jgi:ribosomal protein S18 acetylase RimI-like enzyme
MSGPVEVRELGVPDNEELRAMQRLAARYPERSTHSVDLPYRLSWTRPDDTSRVETALWLAAGELVAWATWLPGQWELQVATSPHAAPRWPEILAWGEARARAQHARRGGAATWTVSARADDAERIELLESEGFHRREWVTVHYERALTGDLAPPSLPEAFSVRPLAGVEEVPAYVTTHRAAFGSTYMNEDWRRGVLSAPGYRPGLDLMLEAPDGRAAAVTIMWLGPECDGRREGQFEPVAVHPDFQRRGLGRALLLDGMRRLRAAGATHALVCTENTRTGANALYSSVMRDTGTRTLSFAREL